MGKGKKQRFVRQEAARYKRLKKAWRRPDGMHSKMRKGIGGKGKSPSIGHGTPSADRDVHPCGMKEVLIHNLSELEGLGTGEAVRFSSRLSRRKKMEALKKAKTMKLKVLNPKLGSIVIGNADELERFAEVKEHVQKFSLSESVEEEEEITSKAKKLGIKLEGVK